MRFEKLAPGARLWVLLVMALVSLPTAAELQDADNAGLKALMKKGVPMINVRTPAEWRETGIIPGSHKLTFYDEYGRYDVERWLSELKTDVPSAGVGRC